MVKLNFICRECGTHIDVSVKEEDLNKWNSGKYHIQDCFPYLSPEDRELFITGICNECFHKIFPEE